MGKIQYEYEVGLPVMDFNYDFEEVQNADSDAIGIALEDFRSANGQDVEGPIIKDMVATFIKFDSNNSSHASGYFSVLMFIEQEQAAKMEKQFD